MTICNFRSTSTCSPVIVVGDGVSSVDCVRHCLERDIPVVHVIRRTLRELRSEFLHWNARDNLASFLKINPLNFQM